MSNIRLLLGLITVLGFLIILAFASFFCTNLFSYLHNEYVVFWISSTIKTNVYANYYSLILFLIPLLYSFIAFLISIIFKINRNSIYYKLCIVPAFFFAPYILLYPFELIMNFIFWILNFIYNVDNYKEHTLYFVYFFFYTILIFSSLFVDDKFKKRSSQQNFEFVSLIFLVPLIIFIFHTIANYIHSKYIHFFIINVLGQKLEHYTKYIGFLCGFLLISVLSYLVTLFRKKINNLESFIFSLPLTFYFCLLLFDLGYWLLTFIPIINNIYYSVIFSIILSIVIFFSIEENYKEIIVSEYINQTTLIIPKEIRNAIQQYLLFFKEYVRATKKQDFDIITEEYEEGVKIKILNTNLPEETINEWLFEYISFIKINIENIELKVEDDTNEEDINWFIVNLHQQLNNLQQQVELAKLKVEYLEKENKGLLQDKEYFKSIQISLLQKPIFPNIPKDKFATEIIQGIVLLISENRISETFEQMDNLGIKNENLEILRQKFIMGKTEFSFYDELRAFILQYKE